MNLTRLADWIDKAIDFRPPRNLIDFCGNYYSIYYSFMWLAAAHLTSRDRYPQNIAVELGCETGRGLVALAIEGSQVVGIDHTRTEGIDKVQAVYDNVVFLQQDTTPLPGWFIEHPEKKIGLLHIDTEHSYEQARVEFETYSPLLTSPAVVIFDDLHAQEDAVLRYFMSLPYPKIQDDRLHPTCGWGALLYLT